MFSTSNTVQLLSLCLDVRVFDSDKGHFVEERTRQPIYRCLIWELKLSIQISRQLSESNFTHYSVDSESDIL